MKLKGRLELIARKVPVCNVAVDIGTDHAYIPIYLVKENRCKRAIASDVRPGPLKIAQKNIKENGLENKIDVRLGSGLESIDDSEIDTVVIAGMGGELIIKILQDDFEKAKKAKSLILQPMTAISDVRQWLLCNGFDIYDEELASEGKKIYTVLCSSWTGEIRNDDIIYYTIGKKLVEKKDPLLKGLIYKKLHKLDMMIEGLKMSSESENTGKAEKMIEIRERLKDLLKGLY
ncbi:MAG TPA: SAM-dependent methyltransferase [Clostridiaceae bacterium]|nr:SAM-dependent methyltransferase [Clostridiaceae bacterium]